MKQTLFWNQWNVLARFLDSDNVISTLIRFLGIWKAY